MTPDPCWLPSAIMQTTAALVGLFAVVYVLARDQIADNLLRGADMLFLTVLWVGLITIGLNTIWLDSLLQELHRASIAKGSLRIFLILLIAIFLYSYLLVRKLRR